ncbi:MAG: methylamine dehydrogenase accessory protein MauD [Myxococcota bacterium]
MVEALIVSNVLLWIAVVALAGLVLALLRQVGVLHERVAPAGALLGREGPRPGEVAPILEAEDWSGRSLRIGGADPEGAGTLLFFVSPSCPVCKELLPVLSSVCADEDPGLRLVVASDGPRKEHEDFVRRHGLESLPYVLSAELGLSYQVGRLPYAVLLDAAGTVRARGLVNTREHLESLFEAREQGVASMKEYLERRAI